ncbi:MULTISPECIES: hypothetical protein [unclassified Oceanispirochaeta]|uniref:hypothetical protein n=1 Tax=unclassified Oceanispirochaeta TaxID=2635722 RepID=UPI000E098240|nr:MULTISPECIES: hypothetical protein [unclassified Oceanispirochaeta]MBF9018835.1 hypothetical protein [Oceanispirochaeta sp. M2]NPD75323.1 hypothetical protein [Oceanispirochaeta sp. M1]RDG28815.1 hypothetical protein DV872_24825 [Oceanispirochaeta sp. M1]
MKVLGKYLLLLFMLSTVALSVSAENIRGPVSGTLILDGLNENRSVTTKVEHLTGIIIKDLSPLIQGIKISVRASDEMVIYKNSFALYIYKDLDKDFSEEENSYRGSQAFMRFLPFSDDLSVLIPLSDAHTLSPDRSSFLMADSNQSEDFPLLISILPITKGIPDTAYNKELTIDISPVYFKKGLLVLNIMNDRAEEISEGIRISIDGKSYDWPNGPYLLNSGLHTLTIRTEDGSEESLPFSLDSGQTLNLDHVLQYQLPLLSIEVMEGLSVYLDQRLLNQSEFETAMEIQPGSHSIRFELGDFKMSRDFTAEMQQRIKITMVPEILLETR